MSNSQSTPNNDKPYQAPKKTNKRYATAAIIVGGGAILGGSLLASTSNPSTRNTGIPFTNSGKQYYVPGDSKRAIYPSKEACMKDVPTQRQSECEPTSSYNGSHGGAWYGPVYNPRDSYQPSPQYLSENANASNLGKKMPNGANSNGFGDNGKAFTGSKGG